MKSQSWFFLRGLVRESAHWGEFLARFAEAFPQKKIVLLDLPGSGAHFRQRSPTEMRSVVSALREDFLRERNEENYFFAVSLGAMVGVDWMQRYPGDFAGGILVNTSLRGFSPFYRRFRPGIYPACLRILTAPSRVAQERAILAMTSTRFDLHLKLAQDWAEISAARPVSRMNALRQLWAAARFLPAPARPPMKLLLLNSLGDRLCSPSCSEEIAKRWNIELKSHPSAGHDLTLDDPTWVIEKIRGWST
ncbi:MAG: alpha/beta fold hydrolase [Bacteriovoracia bacterium]